MGILELKNTINEIKRKKKKNQEMDPTAEQGGQRKVPLSSESKIE